ncbi:hypothetical protein FLX56_26750 [Synechococcus moorigangaii CMS01]|nr:hypothetical protein [Synechococcus moorigangaii CMS01]
MNKLPQSLQEKIKLGWSLQLYNGDRRLIFSLDASHAWILILGLGLGFLSGLVFAAMAPDNPSQPNQTKESTITAPTMVD